MDSNNYNLGSNVVETVPKKEKDFRNIALTVLGVFIVLAIVSGSTFAYYAFSATNSTTVTGTAATADGLALSVTKLAGGTGKLVPQLASTLRKAIVGTGGEKCIDGNGNTVCHIYKIDLTNTATAAFAYKVNISFSGGTFTNLKWVYIPAASYNTSNYNSVTYTSGITSATTSPARTSVPSPVSATAGVQGVATGTLAANSGTASHYIVVWINETGTTQNSIDRGTFTGTVSLTDGSGNSYLTSTFTS